jgi:hypothetical protein
MRKIVLFLGLLLMVTIGGCDRGDDFKDTITKGSWWVDYYADKGDDQTHVFAGYVYTFLADGKVTVTRPGTTPPTGYWNEYNNGTRMEFNFGNTYPLDKLNDTWAIDQIQDDELRFHKIDAPATVLNLHQF